MGVSRREKTGGGGKRHAVVTLLLAAGCGAGESTAPPPAPPPNTASGPLGAIVDSIRQAYGVPAMGGAIVTTQGLQAIGVAGYRRWGGTVPVALGDKWHLGSNLKAQTAAPPRGRSGRPPWRGARRTLQRCRGAPITTATSGS